MRTLQTILLAITILATMSSVAYAQPSIDPQDDLSLFVGTSAFVVANAVPVDEPPVFAQLNFGLRLSPKDTLFMEVITWQYFRPLGIQHWQSGEHFPGKIRDVGVGVGYQRFLWRGAYTSIHAMPFVQQYINEGGRVIQTGFQLFMTLRFGYYFSFFDDAIFVEPSVAFTAWPVNTNAPASFQEQENKWPSYFLFEPGLHIGINF